jgi:hypothetical protein
MVTHIQTLIPFAVTFHSEEGLKLNSVALVRKRTIPAERPPHVGEVSAKFCEQSVPCGQRNESQRPLISIL